MVAVVTAATFCLIAPYLASIFNSHRVIHCLRYAPSIRRTRPKISPLPPSPPPHPPALPPALHASIQPSARVFVWETERRQYLGSAVEQSLTVGLNSLSNHLDVINSCLAVAKDAGREGLQRLCGEQRDGEMERHHMAHAERRYVQTHRAGLR